MVDLKTPRRSVPVRFVRRLPIGGNNLQNIVRQFFDDNFNQEFFSQPVSWLPPVEVTETDNELNITAELPGMSEKDIDVTFQDDVITISGEKSEEKTEEKDNKQYHVVERTYGSFRRSFTLPSNVDASKVVAEFKNGVLSVKLPKTTQEKAAKSRISITVTK